MMSLPTGKDLEAAVYEALDTDWLLPSDIEWSVLNKYFPEHYIDEGFYGERRRIRLAFNRLVKQGRAEKGGWNDIEWRKL